MADPPKMSYGDTKNNATGRSMKSIPSMFSVNFGSNMMELKHLREIQEEEELQGKKNKHKGEEDAHEKVMAESDALGDLKVHLEPFEDLLKRCQTDKEKGLTQQIAKAKLEKDGKNILPEKASWPWYVKLLLEMVGIFSCLLWAGAALAFIGYALDTSDPSNLYLGIVVCLVVIVSGSFTYYQNSKSEAIMAKFKDFIPAKATVKRDGQTLTIDAADLVVGDIVHIREGERIPADVRIFACSEMKVNNASLTGESELQLRDRTSTKDKILEAENMAFFGTTCGAGSGDGVVVQTGVSTIIGLIAKTASTAEQGETTLAVDLRRFMTLIAIIAVSFGVIFFCFGFINGTPLISNFIYAIGIIVANVPEGLLITLTITLSATAARLAEYNVLVTNLQAVETLGSTSCICSDKTGTLTQNKMSPFHGFCCEKEYDFSMGQDEYQRKKETNPHFPERDYRDLRMRKFAHYLGLCSRVELDNPSNEEIKKIIGKKLNILDEAKLTKELVEQHKKEVIENYLKTTLLRDRNIRGGNATEGGIIKYIASFLDYEKERIDAPLAFEIPFNSAVKYCVMIRKICNPETKVFSHYLLLMKGAVEKLLLRSSKYDTGEGIVDFSDELKQKVNKKNNQYGSLGERVIALSYLELDPSRWHENVKFINEGEEDKKNVPTKGLVFLGLISLYDPPRVGIEVSIDKCRDAGIKIIMVTGDQPVTARAIANQIHIITDITQEYGYLVEKGMPKEEAERRCKAIVIHGDELAIRHKADLKKDDNDPEKDLYLQQWLKKKEVVFARLNPVQKLVIVEACQKLGHVVAVTGDGVNDSPAIKQANIGIAMGSGSDVAKDTADMVLLTDDFTSIVIGVEQGRLIFDNLKKSIVYTLASNIPELVPYLLYIAFKIPLPLTTILILLVDVGSDLWPAISFAYEPAELDIMKRKPRIPEKDLLVTKKVIVFSYLQIGVVESFAGMFAYFSVMADYGFKPMNLFFFTFLEGCVPNGDPNQGTAIYDWTTQKNEGDDIRYFYKNCPKTKDKEYANLDYYYSESETLDTVSEISHKYVRYTSEALKYAQTSFWIAIIVTQWSCLVIVKTRSLSLLTQGFNNTPAICGLIFETCLGVLLTYVPPFNIALGTRPLDIRHLGINAFPFFFFIILYDEIRKLLMGALNRIEKGKKPIYSWLHRNSLY